MCHPSKNIQNTFLPHKSWTEIISAPHYNRKNCTWLFMINILIFFKTLLNTLIDSILINDKTHTKTSVGEINHYNLKFFSLLLLPRLISSMSEYRNSKIVFIRSVIHNCAGVWRVFCVLCVVSNKKTQNN